MRIPKNVAIGGAVVFALLVATLQWKSIELVDARSEEAGKDSERTEFAREVNLEYTQGGCLVLRGFK